MDWNEWKGRKVFVRTRTNKVYQGLVVGVSNSFLELTDKYNSQVVLAISEIVEIVDESKRNEGRGF